ncbi:MAG: acyltransferase family protein, partial [Chloroflexi bacterium]|nr:acyltransferase family protein [Chloroflexota bacterium]
VVATPLFVYLNSQSGRRLVGRLARAFTWPGVLFLFPVPLMLLREFPEIAGGNPLFYIAFFIAGFVLMSDPRFEETIDRQRVLLLVTGPLAFAAILVVGSVPAWAANLPGWVLVLADVYVGCFVPWLVTLALLAYGRRLLGFTNRFLRYFAEGAYPLYLLHQTVIVIIGYYVVQWDIPVAAKFALIVAASFASCVLIYDVLVRRINITRFLFGMKPKA